MVLISAVFTRYPAAQWLCALGIALLLGLPAWAQTEEPEPPQEQSAALDPALQERLEAVLEAPPATTDGDTQALLRDILGAEKYLAEGFDEAGPSVIERIIDWISSLFGGVGMPGGATVAILTVLVVVLVAYLVFRLIWEMVQRRAVRDPLKSELREEDMSAGALLKSAEQAALSGDYRSAIRWRFLALLKQLDLPSATVMTNSQLTRLVRKSASSAAPGFAAAASSFEDAWYGGLECGREQYDRLSALAGEVSTQWSAATAEAAA